MITARDNVVRRCDCPSCSGLRVVSEVLEARAVRSRLPMSDKDSVKSKCTVRGQGRLGSKQKHYSRDSFLEAAIHIYGPTYFHLMKNSSSHA